MHSGNEIEKQFIDETKRVQTEANTLQAESEALKTHIKD